MSAVNKTCARYCIDVIRCLLQEREIPPLPEGVLLRELYDFSRKHNVEAMVFHGLEQLEPDEKDPIWQDWQNRASMLLTQSIVQLADRDTLFSALTEAGIRLLPVKGCWMKELYPEIDYRQMSDLDMLIPAEKAMDAKKIMLSLGFETNEFDNEPNHASYLKAPYTAAELHTALLTEDGGFYDDVWTRAHPSADNPRLYRFSPEDEYIYYLLHLNKHLDNSGTGIRSVLDSLVYRRAYPDMDRNAVRKELVQLSLWQRAKQIEKLSDCWFETGAPVPAELAELEVYILSAGSYGTLENYSRRNLEKLEEKYQNPLVRFFAYWLSRVCRPREEMARSYPVLNRLPVLLPVFWVYRTVMRLVTRPKEIWNHMKAVLRGGKNHGSC